MTTTIDLTSKVRTYESHGREKLADVHFRIEIQAYNRALNDYTPETREAEEKAVRAFDDEVVALLQADGWTLRNQNYGHGNCPELTKGAQYLYCHPQDISGEVSPQDVKRMERLFCQMKSVSYRWTDNYGDIIVTTSEEDECQLYRDYYPAGLATTMQSVLATKRKNLYKDKSEAERKVCGLIAIPNRRTDLNDIGTGYYRQRTPVVELMQCEWERLKALGYIIEGTGIGGRPLARWANKAELREINRKL